MDHIYLDHNATAPLLPEVEVAMARGQREGFANPGSQHRTGRRARQMLEDARERIATFLGADLGGSQPDRIIFTSGGTESNNLALFGLAGLHAAPGQILVSSIEHPSVLAAAAELGRRGWKVEHARVTREGVVDIEHFALLLTADDTSRSGIRQNSDPPASSQCSSETPSQFGRIPRLASVMLGNNETGALQPIETLSRLCTQAGVPLHTDAVQVAGKLPIDFRRLGVAAMSIASHKFHGPRGIGALVLRHGVELRPQLFGGFQEQGLRPGTEPVALAVGMAAALESWHREQHQRAARMAALRDRLESAILSDWPDAVVHGRGAPRLPHTVAIAFPGLDRQALVMALDLAGVACSTGSACASGSTDPSPALVAMGCSEELLRGSIRLSLGAATTAAEVDEAARRILKVCNNLRSQKTPRILAATGRIDAENSLQSGVTNLRLE
jgi:cysteine desulfurase